MDTKKHSNKPTVEIVLVNDCTPEYVQRAVPIWLGQSYPCNVTIIDVHSVSEHSLDEATCSKVNRYYRLPSQFGDWSRFVPLAAYDSTFTYFVSSHYLPGREAVEYLLTVAEMLQKFAVLGVEGFNWGYRLGTQQEMAVAAGSSHHQRVDAVVDGCFVKSADLPGVDSWRRKLGWDFARRSLDADLLLNLSLQHQSGHPSYLVATPERTHEQLRQKCLGEQMAVNSNQASRSTLIKLAREWGWSSKR
jgi:hypothetical protein